MTNRSMSNLNGSAPKLARTTSPGVRRPHDGYRLPVRLENA